MNRQQIGTKLTLKALGLELKLDSFDDRLILQKALYLAKASGQDCGYFFRWYLRGPYSAELTRDAFSMLSELQSGEDESHEWELSTDAVERLTCVKQLIPDGDKGAQSEKLELLASVHFLVANGRVAGSDAKAIADLLLRYNKNFSESEVARALQELQTHGLLA